MNEREEALYQLRKGVRDFLCEIPQYDIADPIVEVGRMRPEGKVYEMYPELYVDTRTLFPGRKLISLDIDPETQPDICDDVIHIERHFQPGEVGGVILLHVLEHVTRFWELPAKLHRILKPGGLVFVQTPWNFRFHGPRPDCWRISDDGYEHLFKEHFTILELKKHNPLGHDLHPLAISVVLQKKQEPA